ncbi:MAG: 5'-nucleotidase (lipoprotein e(P4) family) [Marivirga sp.]|jgi:5'-nucleotidase (lipoprotein e(P4) family)
MLKFEQKYLAVKNFLLIATLAIGFSACQLQQKEETPDTAAQTLSNQLGNAVLWFQQSAEMQASFLQAYKLGEVLLKSKLDTINSDKKLAIILDLDETVLDNSPYEARLIRTGANYQSESWEIWCEEASANALPGALAFLNFAHKNGIEIFYISNRKENVFQATLRNLQKIAAPQADSTHLMLRTSTSDKTDRRNMVKAEHHVLLYIGDNLTDYNQAYAERKEDLGKLLVGKNQEELFNNFIMLPNPMYGEWEGALYGNDFSIADSLKLIKRSNILYTAE